MAPFQVCPAINQFLSPITALIIYAETPEQLYERMQIVYQLLRKAGLMAKPSKCKLIKTTINYLGHTFSEGQTQPGGNKIDAVKHFPCPKDVKAVQSFLGLVNFYHRFIPKCTALSGPLLKLLKREIPFQWSKECQDSFERLKEALISSPILILPNFDELFYLTTEASNIAIVAILEQKIDGQLHPILMLVEN